MKKIVVAVVAAVAAAGLVGIAGNANADVRLGNVHPHGDYTDGSAFIAGETGTGSYGRYSS